MNTLNPFSAKTIQINNKITPSLHHHPPFFSKPSSSLFFKTPFYPSLFPIKASSSSSFSLQNPKPHKSLNPVDIPLTPFSFLKPTIIATITAAALLFTRFCFNPKPAIAATTSPAQVTEKNTKGSVFEEENEKALEDFLQSNPNDVTALRKLMEIQVKNGKVTDAISTVDKLIAIQPNEMEWPLLKSHFYVHNGEFELAKNGFNEILKKDPFSVKAYHGLVTVASQGDGVEDWEEVKKMIEERIKMCEMENKKGKLRDFKLLFAQIWVIEDNYNGALQVCEELLKEDSKDFRPYLFKGIIYTLLKKNSEANKCIEEYRKLAPQGHPSARTLDDTFFAIKLFAQREKSGSNS